MNQPILLCIDTQDLTVARYIGRVRYEVPRLDTNGAHQYAVLRELERFRLGGLLRETPA